MIKQMNATLKNHLLIWTDNNRTYGFALLENWRSVAQIINTTCLSSIAKYDSKRAKKQPRPQAKSPHPIELTGDVTSGIVEDNWERGWQKKKITIFEPPGYK